MDQFNYLDAYHDAMANLRSLINTSAASSKGTLNLSRNGLLHLVGNGQMVGNAAPGNHLRPYEPVLLLEKKAISFHLPVVIISGLRVMILLLGIQDANDEKGTSGD